MSRRVVPLVCLLAACADDPPSFALAEALACDAGDVLAAEGGLHAHLLAADGTDDSGVATFDYAPGRPLEARVTGRYDLVSGDFDWERTFEGYWRTAERVEALHRIAYGRAPDAEEKALALRYLEPAGAPPYVKAIRHYARGVALASKGDAAGARAEAGSIGRIAAETDWSTMDAWGVPALPVLQVAQGVVEARAAQAEGNGSAELAMWRKAAEVEATIPYMEPAYWYYPVRQSLGAALLKAGQVEEAEKEFNAALEDARGSAWALYGLEQAAKARGDTAAQSRAAAELARAWRGDPSLLSLDRL